MALAAMVTYLEMNGFTWNCGEVKETAMVLRATAKEMQEGCRHDGIVYRPSRGERQHDHRDCRTRLSQDAPALFAHSDSREAHGARQYLDSAGGFGQFRRSRGGYDAKNDTKQRSEAEGFAQVVEKIGGPERDRTAGLLVANEALSQLSYRPT